MSHSQTCRHTSHICLHLLIYLGPERGTQGELRKKARNPMNIEAQAIETYMRDRKGSREWGDGKS